MSDHPEIPRVEFNQDGESMNVEQAVERFRQMLTTLPHGTTFFKINVEVRPCDCDSDIRGRHELCPLHGDPELLRSYG